MILVKEFLGLDITHRKKESLLYIYPEGHREAIDAPFTGRARLDKHRIFLIHPEFRSGVRLMGISLKDYTAITVKDHIAGAAMDTAFFSYLVDINTKESLSISRCLQGKSFKVAYLGYRVPFGTRSINRRAPLLGSELFMA